MPVDSGSPYNKGAERFFWALINLGGLAFLGFLVWQIMNGKEHLVFSLVVFLMFYVVIFFSFRDAQKIPESTTQNKKKSSSLELFEDYMQQVHWRANTGRFRGIYPNWKYKLYVPKTTQDNELGCLLGILSILGMVTVSAIITGLSMWFRPNSLAMPILVSIVGLLVFVIYFLSGEMKE